jgi:hypothetical protein
MGETLTNIALTDTDFNLGYCTLRDPAAQVWRIRGCVACTELA